MNGHVPEYRLERARDLDEALRLVGDGARPFAGGTDLMVELGAGKLAGRRFVSLWGLAELRGIAETEEGLRLGAMTTYRDVLESGVARRLFPMLGEAARLTGGAAIQNRGTLGGNIGNASPAADMCPVLLAYDAVLELRSAAGARRVGYEGFHTGYKQTVLEPGEIIAAIVLPWRRGEWVDRFRKVAARRAQAIAKVNFAGAARVEDGRILEVRIAYGSMGPTPLRCREAERRVVSGEGWTLGELAPITDVRSTAEYRGRVATNLLRVFLGNLRG
jgi:CO/xanthine dehydrogenase FAD-binding subunit